jgi:hypothetical protein
MFAVINRHRAIPGYSHGTVISLHATELDALLADARLQCRRRGAASRGGRRALVVLPLAVCRSRGEHVRMTDLAGAVGVLSRC